MGFGREVSPAGGWILLRKVNTTYTCPHCHVTKSISDFYPDQSKKNGHSSWCRTCSAARTRARNRLKATTHDRTYRLRKKYGLSRAEFEAIKTRQDNQCAICREDLTRTGPYPGLVLDHGHERGALRTLL